MLSKALLIDVSGVLIFLALAIFANFWGNFNPSTERSTRMKISKLRKLVGAIYTTIGALCVNQVSSILEGLS